MTTLNVATGLKTGVHSPPPLLIGESVLHFQPRVWIASGKSLPSYRVTLSIPFLQETGLCVTDKRVVFPYWLFRLVRFEWVAWFVGDGSAADHDQIEAVSVGRSLLFGPYLQLMTFNPVRHWWRSRTARIRVYMRKPELVYELISERLGSSRP